MFKRNQTRYLWIYIFAIMTLLPGALGCEKIGKSEPRRTAMDQEKEMRQGMITYVNLEGGFYGIIDDAGRHLDPVNLPAQYRKDGLKVNFSYRASKNSVSFHMWGTIIELIEIKEAPDSEAA